MRLRMKTYLTYTVVVLSFICLVNVWMSVFVKYYISDETETQFAYDRHGLESTNLNDNIRNSATRQNHFEEAVLRNQITFQSRYTNKYFTNATISVHYVLNESDIYKQGESVGNKEMLAKDAIENSSVSGQKQTVKAQVEPDSPALDMSKNIRSKQGNTTLNASGDTVVDATGNSDSNITVIAVDDNEANFDISDMDDHIYLAENPHFKHMLEIESNGEIVHAPGRMWKFKHNSNTSYSDRKQVYNMYYRKIVNQGGVDCNRIIERDPSAIKTAKEVMSNVPKRVIRTEKYVYTRDCDNFKRGRGYIEHPLSESERNFPLAFGIVMYRDVEQTERLIRAIYRPHNYYCIHVDSKSDKMIRLAVESIVSCLPNVFIASKVENVTWGEFTVLQADLNCMEELWKYTTWRYYINLTGQEFPLKTNREIVKILEAMEGANIVDGTWVRAKEKYFYRWTSAGNRPPHGIRPIKGSVHVLVNRHFVDFCIHDNRALEFLAWLRKTQIPDETYFASLNHNPHLGIKGAFLGEPEEYPLKPAFMRYKTWESGHSTFTRHCSGKYVRHICILGVGDLHSAYSDIALFVNKFHLDYEYLALDCLEEVLHEKTWQQYLDDTDIDVSYYKHLDYVKYKLS